MGPPGEAAGAAEAAGAEEGLGVLLPLPLSPRLVVVAVVVVVLPLSLLRRSSLWRVAVKGDGNRLGLGMVNGMLGEGFGRRGRLGTPTPPGVEVRRGDNMEGEPIPAGLNGTGLNVEGSRLMSACDKAS